MKKNLLIFPALFLSLLSYADNEDYSYQDVSGQDFSNLSLKSSTWQYATAIGTNFSGSNFSYGSFANANLTNADFSNAVFIGYISDFTDFTDAIITGAKFDSINFAPLKSFDEKLNCVKSVPEKFIPLMEPAFSNMYINKSVVPLKSAFVKSCPEKFQFVSFL